MRITSIRARDVRFPTSREMDGSDAMNPEPDYSAAYVELITDSDAQLTGSGFVFTIGRGNDVEVAAIKAVARQQGKPRPATWRKPVLCPDDPTSCDQNNITTAGAVATPAQPFENRGTFHQAVEIR